MKNRIHQQGLENKKKLKFWSNRTEFSFFHCPYVLMIFLSKSLKKKVFTFEFVHCTVAIFSKSRKKMHPLCADLTKKIHWAFIYFVDEIEEKRNKWKKKKSVNSSLWWIPTFWPLVKRYHFIYHFSSFSPFNWLVFEESVELFTNILSEVMILSKHKFRLAKRKNHFVTKWIDYLSMKTNVFFFSCWSSVWVDIKTLHTFSFIKAITLSIIAMWALKMTVENSRWTWVAWLQFSKWTHKLQLALRLWNICWSEINWPIVLLPIKSVHMYLISVSFSLFFFISDGCLSSNCICVDMA